jgi:hypothetical protein
MHPRKIIQGTISALFVALLASLVACGGGGGASAPAPQPKPPGATYTAFIADEVATFRVTLDIDGGLVDGSTTYTLASTPTGCTFTSNPSDPPDPACSLLAGGEGFLLCDDTAVTDFGLVFLKDSFVPASPSEIDGLVLRRAACGNPSLRLLNETFELRLANESRPSTEVVVGLNSFTLSPSRFAEATSEQGMTSTGLQQRYVFKKVVGPTKTTFFAFDLSKLLFSQSPPLKAYVYMLERPNP